jgi:hypothetical protein
MPTSKVRVGPMVEHNWLLYSPSASEAVVTYLPRSHRFDYVSRQAFLRSYQFSTKENFEERMKRSLKDVKEAMRAVVVDAWIWMSKRKFGISGLDPFKCFMPRRSYYLNDFGL